MKGVIRAILLDPDARSLSLAMTSTYGKQREPMIRMISVLRVFNAKISSGRWKLGLGEKMNQGPFLSPTVFNFFRPTYARAGPIQQAGLVSPELQITNEYSVVLAENALRSVIYNYFTDNLTLDFSKELAVPKDSSPLMDRYDLILFALTLPNDLRAIIQQAVDSIPTNNPLGRVHLAVHLSINSPDYIIQK